MRAQLHIALLSACVVLVGCDRPESDAEEQRRAELVKMRATIELCIETTKSCELIAKNSPYLEPVVMLTRDFTLMVEHRDSMMKDHWIGEYRFMVKWHRGEKLRKKLAIANYGLWLLKSEIELLGQHLDEAKRHARFNPDARSALFQLREESRRLHKAIQYAEEVLGDPNLAQSNEFYDPRFVRSFERMTNQLEELMVE